VKRELAGAQVAALQDAEKFQKASVEKETSEQKLKKQALEQLHGELEAVKRELAGAQVAALQDAEKFQKASVEKETSEQKLKEEVLALQDRVQKLNQEAVDKEESHQRLTAEGVEMQNLAREQSHGAEDGAGASPRRRAVPARGLAAGGEPGQSVGVGRAVGHWSGRDSTGHLLLQQILPRHLTV